MDLQKFVEFLDQYPTWFKMAAVAALAFLVLGLLTLRQPKSAARIPADSAGISSSPAPAPTLDWSAAPRTFADFFKYRQALDGRFLELEEFAKRLEGKEVVWEGFVASVSDRSVRKEFPILMVVASDESRLPGLATVMVPESLRTRAYSLRRGDRIRFEGIITSASSGPSVEAKVIELVPAKSGS